MPNNISVVNGAVMTAIIVIGLVGNSLTLFVISRYRPLRDVTGIFLANLALADLLQSVFGMPLIAASSFNEKWIFGETLCTLSGLTNSLFCIASVLTLTAVSVDRWLAIRHPLKYKALLTLNRAGLVLVYIWSHALFMACLPVFGWSRYAYLSYEFICTVQWESDKAFTIFVSVTSFFVPLIITIVCYSGVRQIACHQARKEPPTTVGKIEPLENLVTVSKIRQGNRSLPYLGVPVGIEFQNTSQVMLLSNQNSQSGVARQLVRFRVENSFSICPITFPDINTQVCRIDVSSTPDQDCQIAIDPYRAGLMGASRGSPKSRLKFAWTGERSQESGHLTVIPGVDETQGFEEDSAPSLKDERAQSHLGRVREWMSERLSNKEKTDTQRQRKKEMKVVLTVLLVNGTFILCWLPHFVGIFCLTFTNGLCPFPDSYHVTTTTLTMLNSVCNPFIYTLTYRKFKTAFKQVLPCFRSSRQVSLPTIVRP